VAFDSWGSGWVALILRGARHECESDRSDIECISFIAF
jgi:hypothetical protein